MTIPEIKRLLEKYKRREITPEEHLQLMQAVQDDAYTAAIKADIMDTLYGETPDMGWDEGQAAAMLEGIFSDGMAERRHLRVVKRRRLVYRSLAAAVVAGLIATGVYYISRTDKQVTPVVAVKQKPLLPGSNKAMLTLADGTVIPLDSAKNGALAQQGNTQITNTNGRLSYNGGATGEKVMYNTVVTPHGGQYQLTLADGSRVWLNAASSIRFPTAFTGNDRTVEITGEAYFEIMQQADKPFHVKVNEVQVNVLGTSFNIMAYQDEQAVKTTLVEGAVQLKHGNDASLLKPGLQASLSAKDDHFVVSPADMEQTLAWKEGKFRFRNTNIRTIMRQLSRWYDIQVSYQGDVSDIDLTGVLSRREEAGNLLTALEATQRVQFEVSGNNVTVRPWGQR
ncbi:FecR family protein [Chitinophaga pinensis]|uniref:Anti-FecI sigma factor, FecR n=1 Tax=Chitinophaga pinensis (strain ATCC 43595 / DSM 2588 / LMG 13176 / NBRC 15968 / NCIMB 11800 / UQM 2034) TaxID=485918 RepID=A0A979GB64_CHIPD|nr:FecR domain-containing protein [Chitinophaga pinensis]ACU64133.1 anti-FecI sigma factor, FecR [Chitinophaga pinensis DSM 2588]